MVFCYDVFRICYVAARKGLQVKLLSMLHVKRCTPVPAILFTVRNQSDNCNNACECHGWNVCMLDVVSIK